MSKADDVRAEVFAACGAGAKRRGGRCSPTCGAADAKALPSLRPGEIVLDLGSGAGFDTILAAWAVGPEGRAIGVDRTPEMVAQARSVADAADVPNVEFRRGEIERLPVADGVADVVISKGAVHCSPDKPAVLREAFRALKPGGRLAIADVVARVSLPDDVRADLARWTGCLAGAATVAELEGWLADAGFVDVRIAEEGGSVGPVESRPAGSQDAPLVVSATIEARKP